MGRSPGGPQDRRPTTRGGRHEAVSFRPRARSVFLSFFLSFHVSFFHHRDTGDTVHAPRAPRHTRLTAMSATATNVPPNMCSCILTTCRPKGSASREAARSDADRTCLPVLAHGKASAAEGQHHLPSHSLTCHWTTKATAAVRPSNTTVEGGPGLNPATVVSLFFRTAPLCQLPIQL